VTLAAEVVRSREEFAGMRSAWNEAVDRMPGANPYLTHEWLTAWLETVGRRCELRCHVVRDGSRIRAAAPLVCRPARYYGAMVRELIFAGDATSDRLQFIADRADAEAHAALWRSIRAALDWRTIARLEEIPAGSPTDRTAPAGALTRGREQSSTLPFVAVAESWDDFEGTLPGKFRHEMRTRPRIFAGWGAWELTFHRGAEVAALVDAMAELETASAKRAAGHAFFADPVNLDFMRRLLALGPPPEPLLTRLLVDGAPVAHSLGFIHHGVFCGYNLAFRPGYEKGSPGKWVVHQTLRWAHEHGLAGFDFSRGASILKQRYRSQNDHNVRIVVFPSNPLLRLLKVVVFDVRPRLKRLTRDAAAGPAT